MMDVIILPHSQRIKSLTGGVRGVVRGSHMVRMIHVAGTKLLHDMKKRVGSCE